jgi:hypothetical protein
VINECILSVEAAFGPHSEEPGSYIVTYEADILTGEGFDEKAGTLEAIVVDLDAAVDAGQFHLDVLDCHSADLAEYLRLFGRNGFIPSISRIAETDLCSLLILHKMEIQPPYRGKELGLSAIEIACQKLGMSCGLAALQAYPIQWADIERVDRQTIARDRAKLMRYYARAGFTRTRFPGFMVKRLTA